MKRFLLHFALVLIAASCFGQQTFVNGYSFYDDFEIGGLDNWNFRPGGYLLPSAYIGTQKCSANGTYGVTTAQAHSGQYSLFNTMTGAGAADCSVIQTIPTADPLHVRFYFYLASGFNIPNGQTIVLADVANASFAQQYFVFLKNQSGNIVLNATCTNVGTHSLTLNAWHSLEMAYSAGAETVSILLDGAAELTGSSCSLPVTPIYLRLGLQQYSGIASGTAYFDDVVVDTSAVGSPAANMVVRHAPTFGRSSVPLLLTMWGTSESDQITVSIDGTQAATYSNSGNNMRIAVPCCTGYSPGNHTLLVQDMNGNTVNASWTETIQAYNSSFPVVIDGGNNMSINGTNAFPIMTFYENAGSSKTDETVSGFWFPSYATVRGWTTGYQTNYNATNFASEISSVASYSPGVMSVGPNGAGDLGCDWANCTGGTFPSTQNASVTTYAKALASSTNLFAYTWIDEPNGNKVNGNPITPQVVENWTSLTHASDPNHLVSVNLTGYSPAALLNQGYFNATPLAELLSIDNYPVLSHCSASQEVPETIATFASYVDQYQRVTYGLYPWNIDLEGSTVFSSCVPTYSATGNQLRMEAWLSIIHGAKGITWFVATAGSNGSSANQLAGMGSIVTLTQTPSVLAALTAPTPHSPYTVTSNQTASGTRVDTMVKQNGNTITVFGQRLTEVGENDSALSTTFTVNGCSINGTATVVGESRTVPVTGCTITDTFNAYDTHVYQFTSDSIAPPTGLTATVH